MTELELMVQRAAAFSLTAKNAQEHELAARLRREAREQIDVTIYGLGRLIAILEQFPAHDARVLRFKEREKHKRLA